MWVTNEELTEHCEEHRQGPGLPLTLPLPQSHYLWALPSSYGKVQIDSEEF